MSGWKPERLVRISPLRVLTTQIFCIDISAEIEKTEFSRPKSKEKLCRLDWVKRFVISFVTAKQRMCHRHEYSLVLLGTHAAWYQHFTGDWTKIAYKLAHLHTTDDIVECNFNSLFSLLCQSVVDSAYVYRVVVFYSRSNVVPSLNADDMVLQHLTSHPDFYLDILYLHSKPSKLCDPQAVYDCLSVLVKGNGYCHECSSSYSRLHLTMASLLPHPHTRPAQEDWAPITFK